MKPTHLVFNRRVILLACIVLLGGLASMAKTFNFHGTLVRDVEQVLGGDFMLHGIIAISLGFTACWATPKYYFRNAFLKLPPLLWMMGFLVSSDEVLQAISPRREFSWLDLSINLSGLFLGAIIYRIILLKQGFKLN